MPLLKTTAFQALKNDLAKTQVNIEAIAKKLETAKNNQEHFRQMLSNSQQTLETAKNASVIKRIFSGVNKEQIEKDIKAYENQYKISKLESKSLQKNLDDLINAKNTISDKIKATSKIDPESGEILTLELITKKEIRSFGKKSKP